MAANFPGPWEVRINYTTALGKTFDHQQRLSFDIATVEGMIGDTFAEWIPEERGGSAVDTLGVKVDEWAALLQDYFANTTTIVNAELWKYALLSFDAVWYSTKPINLVGTNAAANVQNSEQIMTARSDQGGSARLHLMEGPVVRGDKEVLPLTSGPLDLLADEWMAVTNIWRARDNGYPISFLGMFPGENERLFKKEFR